MTEIRRPPALGRGSSKGGGSRSYVKGTPSKEGEAVRSAFFRFKKKRAGKSSLTPLQRRMQSGGA